MGTKCTMEPFEAPAGFFLFCFVFLKFLFFKISFNAFSKLFVICFLFLMSFSVF